MKPSEPPGQIKVSFDVVSLQMADWLSTSMMELIEPAAHAATRFVIGDGWRVEGYFHAMPDASELIARLAGVVPFELPASTVEHVPAENWVAISQAALPPVTVGRFTVHGSHDRARVPPGPYAIEIDAGEAFGTAHHATTTGCLEAIDRLSRSRKFCRILDLGCGSGVLAIAARRLLPKAAITAADIDPEAVRVAGDNARRNRARIEVCTANGIPRARDPANSRRFDLIVANILAGPLIRLTPAIARHIEPGGAIVLSGILEFESAGVIATYVAHGFILQRHERIAGWSALTFIRCGRRSHPNRQPSRSPA